VLCSRAGGAREEDEAQSEARHGSMMP
jgi:hypothetical protein